MKVGVFGGTFDPPHIGHLVAAEETRRALDLERVVFVPAGKPYHKHDGPVTPVEHRVEMITRAIASNPYFAVSLIDVGRTGPSYTVELIKALLDLWGSQTELYFIMGKDSLVDIPNWYKPQELVKLCRLAVVDRPGYDVDMDHLENAVPGIAQQVDFVTMPRLEISSTVLERRLRRGWPIRYLVPLEVELYIQAHGLYT